MGIIKALIIDDSAFMRKSISIMLESDPDIKIAGTAKNGEEGLELLKSLNPDIVTLDIEMPGMNGLEVLEKIMKYCPTPVIMISSLTTEGAEATLKALELGAVDFIPKELSYINVNIIKIKEELIRKVKEIVKHTHFRRNLNRVARINTPFEQKQLLKTLPVNNYKAVALGISTGGPMSLQKIFPLLSDRINCPMFVVQHMPPKFTKSLAERLNNLTSLTVKEAENDEAIKNSTIYIAPGGYHMTIKKKYGSGNFICISEKPDNTLHRPSVDVMFSSVADCYGKNVIAVIMTGMGRDGTEGTKLIKNLGGYCLAQNEETCVVYGMPKSVVEAGLADSVAQLNDIPLIINKAFGL